MPDWFYRTVARPLLFRLNDRTARTLALGMVGTLGRGKLGRAVIDFLGHMRPDPRIAVEVDAVSFPSPVGIGWRVDPERRATRALTQFGAGFLVEDNTGQRTVTRGPERSLRDLTGAPRRHENVDTVEHFPQ